MKKVLKYGTGLEVPEEAEYLSTVVEELFLINRDGEPSEHNKRYVWHYFLVEVKQ